ncbi:MAG: 3-oxoacyl-ACP reductase FabG [Myxococcales bacterium]|nr:3-oxoacyl-ACP reductase FabG [Myxococcales bacterium]
MFRLDGRVALVTGASRGIGRAIALTLARQGARVAINYNARREAAEETLALVEAAGGAGFIVPFDVGSTEAVNDAVAGIVRDHKSLGVVVSNAGVNVDGLLPMMRDDDVAKMFQTNVFGAIALARAAVKTMIRARYGRIVMISSVVGQSGNAGQSVYAATKSALVGLTKSLAKEYGKRGVTANVVAPGFVETEMTAGLSDELQQKLRESTAAGRLGSAADVAAAVAYLASDEAAYVTGQVLGVNGGLYM